MIPVTRTSIRLKADPRKIIVKFLGITDPSRIHPVAQYVHGLSEHEIAEELQKILADFEGRHFNLKAVFLASYHKVATVVPGAISNSAKLLIGAYFTHEYSIEASALFNPSIVPHPDQEDLNKDELRFLMSLRATGEGHISSISFQTGIVAATGEVKLDHQANKLSIGEKHPPTQLKQNKDAGSTEAIPNFTTADYDLSFPSEISINSRVLFPQTPVESNGIEDVRFVLFEDGEERCYYGTYTAYNGREIQPHLISTEDFTTFKIRAFRGAGASNKGMALFPEKINGRYAMVGRQGGRNLSIMYSEDLLTWEDYELLQQPQRGWEMLQMGNCGSPVKTDKGWLLLTHAVGPMRKYVLSFTLLELEHPERVIASLDQPFMSTNEEEREGYVPNVLYTCGLLEHQGQLVIPYAMSDSSISIALVRTKEVLKELLGE